MKDKALTIKDFFTETQLAFLAQEIEDKPETREAFTQTEDPKPQLKPAQAEAGTQIEILDEVHDVYGVPNILIHYRNVHPEFDEYSDLEVWTHRQMAEKTRLTWLKFDKEAVEKRQKK